MASGHQEGYFPTRAENSSQDNAQRHETGYPPEDIEQPSPTLAPTNPSDAGTESPNLTRSNTSKSEHLRRQNTFEPIRDGDRAALQRLASEFSGNDELARVLTGVSSTLQRRETLAGFEPGNPILDPKSPEFDVYKWAKMVSVFSLLFYENSRLTH